MAPPAAIEADDWVEEEPELEPEEAPAPEPTHHARLMPPLPATSMLTLSESPPGAVVIHAKSAGPSPTTVTLSESEFPPSAIVTLATSEAPAPIVVKPIAKAAPPPLPETPSQPETPSLTMTEATIDVVPRAPLMPNVALAQSAGSAPRSRSKVLVASALAAALLGGAIVVAIVNSRSAESDPNVNHIAPAEDPRPTASMVPAPPPAPVEVPSAAASVEVPATAASAQAPAPSASVEAPAPVASVEAPAPAVAEKKGPSEAPPSEAIATAKPIAPAPAAAPRPAATPETDLSGLQPSKPARIDTRADDDTLQQALAQAAERAKGCRDSTSPTGVASVSVTIAGSGDATGAVVQGPPFAHTLEGDCIAAKFRAIHIPAFRGDSINVRKSVSLQ